jgi:hypothetical protein
MGRLPCLTQTTAPTFWRAAEISASRNFLARPPLPTQSATSRVSPLILSLPKDGRADVDVATKADNVFKMNAFQEFEQFDVAEPAVGQDRHRHALGQQRLQAGLARVLEIVAMVLQFVLVDGQPEQRRGPSVAGNEMQRVD